MNRQTKLNVASLLAVAGFAFTSVGALAFDEDQYRSIKADGSACLFCDLSGADFAEVDLAGANLTGSDLTGANLTGTILRVRTSPEPTSRMPP